MAALPPLPTWRKTGRTATPSQLMDLEEYVWVEAVAYDDRGRPQGQLVVYLAEAGDRVGAEEGAGYIGNIRCRMGSINGGSSRPVVHMQWTELCPSTSASTR